MQKLLLGLSLLLVMTTGCFRPYVTVVEPTGSLKRFGKFTTGDFNIQRYMQRLQGSAKQENYEKVTIDANNAVSGHVTSILHGLVGTPGGPELVLSAELDEFRTGSGAARGLSAFGLAPKGVGDGIISYFVTLKSGGKIVGSCKVSTKISKAADQAYMATGKHISEFVSDHME